MPSDGVLIDAAIYAEDEWGSRGDCGPEMDTYYREKAAEPFRKMIRAAVEQAVAEQEARHERELIETRIDAIENFDGWTSFEWAKEMRAKLDALEAKP